MKRQRVLSFFSLRQLWETPHFVFLTVMLLCGALAGSFTGLRSGQYEGALLEQLAGQMTAPISGYLMEIHRACAVGSRDVAGSSYFIWQTARKQLTDIWSVCSTWFSGGVFCGSVFGSLFMAWTCAVPIDWRCECGDNDPVPAHHQYSVLFGRAGQETTERLLVYASAVSRGDFMLYAALCGRRHCANPYVTVGIGYGVLRA